MFHGSVYVPFQDLIRLKIEHCEDVTIGPDRTQLARRLASLRTKTRSARSVMSSNVLETTLVAFAAVKTNDARAQTAIATLVIDSSILHIHAGICRKFSASSR